jgi:hypothetical protein
VIGARNEGIRTGEREGRKRKSGPSAILIESPEDDEVFVFGKMKAEDGGVGE